MLLLTPKTPKLVPHHLFSRGHHVLSFLVSFESSLWLLCYYTVRRYIRYKEFPWNNIWRLL